MRLRQERSLLPGIFLGYALIVGGLWKGVILIADQVELKNLDASAIYPPRINAKEILVTQKGDEFVFSNCRWCSRTFRKRLRIPWTRVKAGRKCKKWTSQVRDSRRNGGTSTSRNERLRWSPYRLLVNSRWLHLSPSQWTSCSTQCAKRRNIPYSPEVYWCNQNHTHWFGRHAREAYWRLLECWFEQKFVRFVEWFHEIHIIERKTFPNGYMWSGREIDKSSSNHTTRSRVAGGMVQRWRSRTESRKTRMGNGKVYIELQCSTVERNFSSLIQMMKNIRRQWRRTLVSIHGTGKKKHREFLATGTTLGCLSTEAEDEIWLHGGNSRIHKTKSRTISTKASWRSHCRPRMHIDETLQFGSQVHPDAASNQDPRRQRSSGQSMEEARKDSSLEIWNKFEARKRSSWRHKETKEKSTLLH